MKLTPQERKRLYHPHKYHQIFTVPPLKYITLDGKGDPNSPSFLKVIEALYSLTYTIKMSYRSQNPPLQYYEYKVFPLEGEWTLIDPSKGSLDKSNFAYKMMIQQPDFVDEALFLSLLESVKAKKENEQLSQLKFEYLDEGLCAQTLHIGKFDDEPQTFARLEAWLNEQGYERTCFDHKEIYLSDPRRTAPDKLKTLLRVRIRKMQK